MTPEKLDELICRAKLAIAAETGGVAAGPAPHSACSPERCAAAAVMAIAGPIELAIDENVAAALRTGVAIARQLKEECGAEQRDAAARGQSPLGYRSLTAEIIEAAIAGHLAEVEGRIASLKRTQRPFDPARTALAPNSIDARAGSCNA
jgi:hypothetical protein